jgi:hypothetical protein
MEERLRTGPIQVAQLTLQRSILQLLRNDTELAHRRKLPFPSIWEVRGSVNRPKLPLVDSRKSDQVDAGQRTAKLPYLTADEAGDTLA